MKYSILGFNQKLVVDYSKDNLKCDLTDLLLLNYIMYAQSNPKMNHILDDEGQPCVWLCHQHILEDLPILNMTDGTLKNRLTKLRKMDLICSKTISKEKTQGSKTYYRITSFLNDMLYETTSFLNEPVEEARHFKMTSYNKQVNKNDNKVKENVVSKDTTDESGFLKHHSLVPKQSQNLYSKCVCQINNFTKNPEVKSALLDYLHFRLEKGRDVNKPLYSNMWKGMLNKLKKEFDEKEWEGIIRQSLEKGWMSFYESTKQSRSSLPAGKQFDPDSKTVHRTEEWKREQEKFIADRKAKGLQVVF